MVPVGGRPFLFYLLQLLKLRGLQDIILCIGYLGEQILEHFGDGRKMGLRIRYSYEKERLLGTGGALKLAENLLQEEFLVINGDTFLDIDYQGIYQMLMVNSKKALIVAFSSGKGERSDLEIRDNLIVTRYDKDTKDTLGYVNAGVLGLKFEVVERINPDHPVSLEKDIFPELIAKQEMMAYITNLKFYDIGTFDKLRVFETCLQGKE